MWAHKKWMLPIIISFLLFHFSASSTLALQQANLYRNKDYTFSVKFPKGWDIRSGQTPHTVVVSENLKGESVVIQVWRLPVKINLEELSVKDLQSYIGDTFEGFKGRYSNAKLHGSGITYISNVKAIWIVFTYTLKHAFEAVSVKTIMYQIFYEGRMYQIMCSSSPERFKQAESSFLNTIRSFIFEESAWYK